MAKAKTKPAKAKAPAAKAKPAPKAKTKAKTPKAKAPAKKPVAKAKPAPKAPKTKTPKSKVRTDKTVSTKALKETIAKGVSGKTGKKSNNKGNVTAAGVAGTPIAVARKTRGKGGKKPAAPKASSKKTIHPNHERATQIVKLGGALNLAHAHQLIEAHDKATKKPVKHAKEKAPKALAQPKKPVRKSRALVPYVAPAKKVDNGPVNLVGKHTRVKKATGPAVKAVKVGKHVRIGGGKVNLFKA